MDKKRSKLEIIKDILKVIQERNGRVKPTHILYKSNLSHQMMTEYMQDLIGKGFIIESAVKTGKTYSLTEKGYQYLTEYHKIADFMNSFGLE